MPPARTKQIAPPPPSMWIGLLFVLIQLVIIGILWVQLPPQLPLYYSIPYGFNRLIPKILVWMLPSISLFTVIVGTLLSHVRLQTMIYRHIQFWLVQLVLLLQTIALLHTIIVVL